MAAEDNAGNVEPITSPAQGDGEAQDFEALYRQAVKESRKWEERAKANKEKADKWDEAAAGAETLEERLAALESENKAMKDAKARHDLVMKVAEATGISPAIVDTLSGPDEETLTAQALAIAELTPKGAPEAPEAGKFPRKQNTKSNAAKFSDSFTQLLGR